LPRALAAHPEVLAVKNGEHLRMTAVRAVLHDHDFVRN
jgi:hypothetical protein